MYIQESVQKRLSQRFRNMRRYSEKLQPGTIIVKASLNDPQTEVIQNKPTDNEDLTAYTRNMESLLLAFKKQRPLTDSVKKLLKLTFEKRKTIIDEYLLHTTELLEQFPFLKVKAWVSYT